MKISVNLATRPFVELRPLFALLRLVMAGLALVAIGLGMGLHYMSRRARAEEAQMDALKAQTAAFDHERMSNEARMQEPQNRAVLDRSLFLYDLFARTSFSWTAVMMDLERVLPAGVQVTSIEPSVTAEGDVNIRLRVSGDRELAVQLVRNLERSQRFLSPRLATETAQTPEQGRAMPVAATPGGVEFVILSGYNPLPLALKAMDDKAKQSEPAPAQAEMVQPAVHTHAKGKTAAGAGRPKKAAGAPKARGVKP